MSIAKGMSLLGSIGLLAAVAAPGLAEETKFFYTNFSGKEVDAEIGTGGPLVGEPTEVESLSAIVRMAPFNTACLEFTDVTDGDPGWSRFGFIDEAVEGTVNVRFKLWFDAYENFGVYLRGANSNVMKFLNLRFHDDGTVSHSDMTEGGVVGTYTAGVEQRVDIAYDLSGASYDVFLNGSELIMDRACDTGTAGIGAVFFSMERDADSGGTVAIDDLDVYGAAPTPVEASTWSAVKDQFTD